MRVTVYSKANCPACKLTCGKLDKNNIPYEKLRVDLDPDAKAKAESYGYLAAPVVVVELGDGAEWTWAGMKPDEINRLVDLYPQEVRAA